MAISNLVTSPHCVCYINSVPLARVCGLNFNVESPRKALHGVDILEPVDLVPTSLSIHGTLQLYRLGQDGGAEAAGLIGTWKSITREKYASMYVLDRRTDTILVQVDKMCVTSQSWHVAPKSFVMGTIAFTGFGYGNGAE